MTKIHSRARAGRRDLITGHEKTLIRNCALFSLLLIAILIWLAATGIPAFAASAPAASAASISGREAQLNGSPMPVGATLFPGDVVRLGHNSTAALRFQKNVVLAAPQTELVVESDGVRLRNGRLQVRADGAESFGVSGPFFHVKMAALPEGAPSSAEIRLAGLRAQISAFAGAADVSAEGNLAPYRLSAGETATLDATGATAENLTDVTPPAGQADQAGQGGQSGQAPAVAAKRSIIPVVVTLTGVGAAIGIGVWQATRPPVSSSAP